MERTIQHGANLNAYKNEYVNRGNFNHPCYLISDMHNRKIRNGVTIMVRPHPHKKLSGAFLKPQPHYTNGDHQQRFGREDYHCTQCGAKATSLKDIQDHKYKEHAY